MKISPIDFMLFQYQGINLFIQSVDAVVAQTGEPYQDAVKRLQKELKEYGARRDAFNARPVEAPIPQPMTMTLGRLLERRTCNSQAYKQLGRNIVYVIRDGEHVLYVGSTRNDVRTRMKSHEKTLSPLGNALRTDPDRFNWSVEMIPHTDYDAAVSREKELIRQLRPPFCRKF